MSILARASRRRLWRHPWQMALVILGVALGVAVVVAVDLANAGASRAFSLSSESVTGRATHRIVGGPTGIDEQLYVRLRKERGLQALAPVVEAYARSSDETLRLLGVDPFAESAVRGYLDSTGDVPLRQLLTRRDAVLLAAPTAQRLGLTVGDPLPLRIAGQAHTLTLVGLVEAKENRAAIDGLLIADIASAQELTGQFGRLSWIDVILTEQDVGAAMLAGALPPGVRLEEAGARAQALLEMTRAFRTNLTAMSLLALVVGMFLVYNAMRFSVLQRRALFGTLRALGATGGEIFRLILGEALVIALLGTLLGLLLGVVLGQGLVQLVTRTINDIYFVMTVRDIPLSGASLAKGLALGLAATALATLAPAWEAARTAPRLNLSRSVLEARVRRAVPRLAVLGGGLIALSLVVVTVSARDLVAGFAGLFFLVVGLALLTPLAVTGMVRLAWPFVRRLGVSARLAVRGISASLSRTGVAMAALTLAVATTVGVGVMVGSFRSAVDTWLQASLRADIYISMAAADSKTPPPLDPRVADAVARVPDIADVGRVRFLTLRHEQAPIGLAALDLPETQLAGYEFRAGDARSAWRRMQAGEAVLVSEPYAYRFRLGVGDTLSLQTLDGEQAFAIAGVLVDYSSEHGTIYMARDTYRRHFGDDSLSALRLTLTPGADIETAMARLRAALPEDAPVHIRSHRDIRTESLAIFDRTFTITTVLRLLAFVVAFVGILSAFMALQLERAREFAILRATGFTRAQVQGLVALQSGLMGLAAGLLALPVGALLAWNLIHVINRRAFGWTMDIGIPPQVLLEAVALAVVAAVLAGLYPGWRLAHAPPAAALREE